jgi:hypothetical protein
MVDDSVGRVGCWPLRTSFHLREVNKMDVGRLYTLPHAPLLTFHVCSLIQTAPRLFLYSVNEARPPHEQTQPNLPVLVRRRPHTHVWLNRITTIDKPDPTDTAGPLIPWIDYGSIAHIAPPKEKPVPDSANSDKGSKTQTTASTRPSEFYKLGHLAGCSPAASNSHRQPATASPIPQRRAVRG